MNVRPENTAIILIGYQNDYFHPEGSLRSVIESSSQETLKNTLEILENSGDMTTFTTPIVFTQNYEEITQPVGILQSIKEIGAFQKGTKGVETIEELNEFSEKIIEVPGKVGLNAFYNTNLDSLLSIKKIENVLIAGAVCSICVDSTARSAHERGYNVGIISDAISGRSDFEVSFYLENIFPLYASLITSKELVKTLNSC